MLKRLLLFALLGLALLFTRAPATLLDQAVQRVSTGTLRLEQAAGSLWHGSGVLVLRGAWHAPIAWQFSPAGLLRGELLWRNLPGGAVQGELALSPGGLGGRNIALSVPAGLVLPLLPGPLASAGWGGKLTLQADDWYCTWAKSCRGRLRVEWLDAGCALLPEPALGSYALELTGAGQGIGLLARPLAGEIAISGQGKFDPTTQHAAFSGRIAAPPAILHLLPGIAAGFVEDDGTSGSLGIIFPARRGYRD